MSGYLMDNARAVYFARRESDGAIKVGNSAEPIVRLVTLRRRYRCDFTLLGMVRGGVRSEARVHQHFAALRLDGEFFRPAPELLAFIASPNLEQLPPLRMTAIRVAYTRLIMWRRLVSPWMPKERQMRPSVDEVRGDAISRAIWRRVPASSPTAGEAA